MQYCLKIKTAYSLVSYWITVLNNILLLITRSCLSVAQASGSFKCLDTCTFMYTTPSFVTEALHLATQVQLLLMTVTVN